MPLVESIVKFINQRMHDTEKYFGVKSFEYNRLKNVLYQEFGSQYDVLLREDKKTGTVQLARSKKALEAFNDTANEILEDVNREIRSFGTIRQQALEYIDNKKMTLKELKAPDIQNTIRKMSFERLRSAYVDDDIYNEVNKLLLKESEKLGLPNFDFDFYERLQQIHDVLTEKGRNRDYAYAIAEQMLTDAKLEHEKFLRDTILSESYDEEPIGGNE